MPAIKVINVHKKFKVYYDKGYSLKEKLLFRGRNHYEDRWVLKGVSFEVEKGEVIGIIGENGCGKSTLLKLLTKIMYPDSGAIEIKGRVSSLIELGAGFHPDMSGRENIYTNASIFGLTKKEIDERLDDIIDFSELAEFIDNPVRTYSSGMYMRLAFSVAINVDADVLLIDEILAVGDANFQVKCFNHLRKLKGKGVTIVLVTHDSNTIETFCNKAIWINNGKIALYDKSSKVVEKYLDYMNEKRFEQLSRQNDKTTVSQTEEEPSKAGTVSPEAQFSREEVMDKPAPIISDESMMQYQPIKITGVSILNADGKETSVVRTGESMAIEIRYRSTIESDRFNFGIGLWTMDGVRIYGTTTAQENISLRVCSGEGILRFLVNKLELLAGQVSVHVAVAEIDSDFIQYLRDCTSYEIISKEKSVGITNVCHIWENDEIQQVQEYDIAEAGAGIGLYEPPSLSVNSLLDAMDNPLVEQKILQILNHNIRVFGDKSRLHLKKTANLVNTLFNTVSGEIVIGEYVFTGHNVSILTGTHDIYSTGKSRQEAYPQKGNDIIIHDGVWLSSNSIVLGPCIIEENAVVAAGSLVLPNTHIKAGDVYAGIPAKRVKNIYE